MPPEHTMALEILQSGVGRLLEECRLESGFRRVKVTFMRDRASGATELR